MNELLLFGAAIFFSGSAGANEDVLQVLRSLPAEGRAVSESGEHLGIGAVIYYEPKSCAWTIKALLHNSPAERAGLQKGDHILSMDDVPLLRPKKVRHKVGSECLPEAALLDLDRLSAAFAKSGHGTPIEIVVERSGLFLSFESELLGVDEMRAAELQK